MKKITLLKSHAFKLGGLEKYTLRLAKAFLKKGCEVNILTTEGSVPKSLSSGGLHFIPITKSSKLSLKHLHDFDAACRFWVKQNPQDIVFGMERTTLQSHYRAGSGVHATFLQQRTLVDSRWKRFSFLLNPLHRLILNYEKKCFESPDLKKLFTNSHMVKEEIHNHYQVDREKIEVIHNGVEWQEMESKFHEGFSQNDLRQKLGLDPASFQFLFIGNGYRRKGLTFLLKGLSLLHKKNFQLSIVGKEKDSREFYKLASDLHLADRVKFFGPRSDAILFYQACDSLVIPSIYDPFANVTIEALAMGLHVVSSIYNGGREILTEETGSVIELLTDRESVAAALQRALRFPKTAASAKKIRESVKGYDFTHQLDKIVSLTI